MTKNEAMQMALEAMIEINNTGDTQVLDTFVAPIVIPALRAALEAERKWVGLTAEDLAQIESDEFWQVGNHMAIALAVEEKLRKKNHDTN